MNTKDEARRVADRLWEKARDGIFALDGDAFREEVKEALDEAVKAGERKMALSLKGIVSMSQLRRLQTQLEGK